MDKTQLINLLKKSPNISFNKIIKSLKNSAQYSLPLIGLVAVLGGLGGATYYALNGGMLDVQERREKVGVEEKSLSNLPPKIDQLAPYTILLNQDNTVTIIQSDGVKINIAGLTKPQIECLSFGGGINCISEPPVESQTEVANQSDFSDKTEKIEIDSAAIIEGIKSNEWVLPLVAASAIWYLFIRQRNNQ